MAACTHHYHPLRLIPVVKSASKHPLQTSSELHHAAVTTTASNSCSQVHWHCGLRDRLRTSSTSELRSRKRQTATSTSQCAVAATRAAASSTASGGGLSGPTNDDAAAEVKLDAGGFFRPEASFEKGWEKIRGSAAPARSDIFWAGVGTFLAFAGFSLFDHLLLPHGIVVGIGPFAAVATILLALPNAPPARKWNVLIGHLGAGLIAVAALSLFGASWLTRSLGIAATVMFMQFTDSIHPPAAGLLPLLFDGAKFQKLKWSYVVIPGILGCLWLFFVQVVITKLKNKFKF